MPSITWERMGMLATSTSMYPFNCRSSRHGQLQLPKKFTPSTPCWSKWKRFAAHCHDIRNQFLSTLWSCDHQRLGDGFTGPCQSTGTAKWIHCNPWNWKINHWIIIDELIIIEYWYWENPPLEYPNHCFPTNFK